MGKFSKIYYTELLEDSTGSASKENQSNENLKELCSIGVPALVISALVRYTIFGNPITFRIVLCYQQ